MGPSSAPKPTRTALEPTKLIQGQQQGQQQRPKQQFDRRGNNQNNRNYGNNQFRPNRTAKKNANKTAKPAPTQEEQDAAMARALHRQMQGLQPEEEQWVTATKTVTRRNVQTVQAF